MNKMSYTTFMGLLYIMPASIEEIDHVKIENDEKNKKIILSSYGLPLMFWGYFLVLITLELAMFFSVQAIAIKLMNSEELFDKIIAWGCLITMVIIPFFCLCMLFFQKKIIRDNTKITITWNVFGIQLRKKVFDYHESTDELRVSHLLESANMAKIKKDPKTRAFENQGHYILILIKDGQEIFLDRHTRKQDLVKLSGLIANRG